MEENEHLLPGSPFPREISSSKNEKKRGASWLVKVLLVSLFLSLSVLGTVGFLSNAVVTREDEHQTKTKMILMKFLSLGDAGEQKAKEEKKAKNGFKIRVPFIRHHGCSEKPRETSEKNTGPIEMAKRSLSKEHGNNEDLVKVMEENAKKRLLFKAAAEAREGPARGLDEDENIAGDGESVGGDERRRVSSPRAVSVSSSAEDDDDDDSNKRSPSCLLYTSPSPRDRG